MKNNTLQYQKLSDDIYLTTYGGEITTETSLMYDVAYVLGALVNSMQYGYTPSGRVAFFFSMF
jgi:hypothetical protein